MSDAISKLERLMMSQFGASVELVSKKPNKPRDSTSKSNSGWNQVEDMRSDDEFGSEISDGSASLDESSESEDDNNTHREAQVIVFQDNPTRKSSSAGNKRDWKEFMSSDISKLSGTKVKKVKQNIEEINQEKEDDRNDKELMDILQTTKLIEQFNASELTGKEKRDYYRKKMCQLGNLPTKEKAPAYIRFGIEKKEKQTLAKRLQEAKDSGMYHASMKNQFIDEKTKTKIEKEKRNAKKSRGLTGSIGKYKDGVLHISKKDIEAVGGSEKKGVYGNAFRAISGQTRPRSNKKNKKKK